MITETKDPAKVRAGRLGAEARFGVPRHVDLRDLPASQRRLVLAFVDLARAAKETAPTIEAAGAVETGGTGDACRQG
ncbi:MAG: hypothetical protein ABSG37_04185 [Candidatus Limnocylindrales bacterium]